MYMKVNLEHRWCFFAKINCFDARVAEKFDFLEPYLMIELLQTFVFLEIIPVNFFRRVFNPTFFFKLKSKYLEITTVSFPKVKSDPSLFCKLNNCALDPPYYE